MAATVRLNTMNAGPQRGREPTRVTYDFRLVKPRVSLGNIALAPPIKCCDCHSNLLHVLRRSDAYRTWQGVVKRFSSLRTFRHWLQLILVRLALLSYMRSSSYCLICCSCRGCAMRESSWSQSTRHRSNHVKQYDYSETRATRERVCYGIRLTTSSPQVGFLGIESNGRGVETRV